MGVYKGKSVDEAIENGLLDLNLKKEDVHIHVIEKGQAGIFGFFEKEAEVEITPLTEKELKLKKLAPYLSAGGFVILILFFKQVSKGDFVSSLDKNIEGTVQSIHILYTIIQQPNGPVIIVPNSQIANASIINYSKNPFRRLDLIYSASYDVPVDKVISVLHQVIENEPRIIKNDPDRPITISLSKQNASSLDYVFRAWVRKEDYLDTMLDCNINVKKFFDKNGIEIPYNKLDLYVKNNINIDNKQ